MRISWGAVFAVIMTAVIVALIIFQFNNMSEVNRWTKECNEMGGIVSQVSVHWFHDRLECFVDGKQVVVPGWEGN